MYSPKLPYHSILPLVRLLVICACIVACEKDERIPGSLQPGTMMVPMKDTLPSFIAENTLLTNTHPWYIADWVYVSNEATLAIEPGTIIKIAGKKDTGAGLVITRGAKIMASGLPNWPVLFQLPDTAHSCDIGWSGIVLLGRAPQKQPYTVKDNIVDIRNSSGWAYGGELPDDSSGVLQHVRIVTKPCKCDAAGKQLQEGLLLLGAGSKTVVEDVVIDSSENSLYRITAAPLK